MNRKPLSIGLLCLAAISFSTTCFSQQFFDQTRNLPAVYTDGKTMDVAIADLDGDQHKDIIVAKEFARNGVLWNDGTGRFFVDSTRLLPVILQYTNPAITGEDSEDIVVFDADGDQDPDLLFVSEETNYHELLLNDGQGNFSLSAYQFPKTQHSNAVLVYDFSGDRKPDVLLGHNGQNTLYLNNGDGTFSEDIIGIWPTNLDWTQDLAGADLDNDGDMDIVEGCDQGGSNLYINEGGRFVESNTRWPNVLIQTAETRKVLMADVDQDEDIDILLCNVGWNPISDPQDRLLINDGQGNFTDGTITQFPFFHNVTLDGAFAQFNADSLPDLIVTTQGERENYTVYLNDPSNPGRFLEDSTFVFPFFSLGTGLALAQEDLNNDGRMDFYFGTHTGPDRLFISATSVGLAETKNLKQLLKLYPNPTRDELTVEWQGKSVLTVDIYAINLQKVRSGLSIEPGSQKINVAGLVPGRYLISPSQAMPSKGNTLFFIKQ